MLLLLCSKHQTGKEHKQLRRIKVKQHKRESQEVSSFPADDHKATLNTINKQSKTHRKRTNHDS